MTIYASLDNLSLYIVYKMNPTSEIGMETIAQNSYYGALVAGLLGLFY